MNLLRQASCATDAIITATVWKGGWWGSADLVSVRYLAETVSPVIHARIREILLFGRM